MFHQVHLINLSMTLGRLKFLIDEHCTHADAATLEPEMMLQRYLKYLLMGEMVPNHRIRDRLAVLMPRDKYKRVLLESLELAQQIEEEIHDDLLNHVRPFLSLDESEKVVELMVMPNGDAQIVVEEREIIRQMADAVLDEDYGRCDTEEHSLQKMIY